MSNFQFSMQKILNVKKKNKQQKELDFSRIANLLDLERNNLNELIELYNHIRFELVNLQKKGASIFLLNENQNYLSYLDTKIDAQQLKIDNLQTSLKNKQQELVEVKIEVEKWLKLRENKFQEFMLSYNQNEQKEIDEIASHIMYR